MRTLKLTLAYDGTNYAGWQRQADQPTIQARVEDAVAEIEGRRVPTQGAGRTDAGVHALGQVASLRLHHQIEAPALTRALNAKLPCDIRVLGVDEVAPGFHARFSAVGKTYRYRLFLGTVLSPFESRYVWHVPQRLDVAAMQAAGDHLCGRHDFAAFQAAASEGGPASTVRTLRAVQVGLEPVPAPTAAIGVTPSDVAIVEVSGDGFLRHMVRTIVGTLVEVGAGRWSIEDVGAALRSHRREHAGPTAPASGLFLVGVDYP